MTEEQKTLREIQNAIAELSTPDLAVVSEAAGRIGLILSSYPGGHAAMALALIGAELAAR